MAVQNTPIERMVDAALVGVGIDYGVVLKASRSQDDHGRIVVEVVPRPLVETLPGTEFLKRHAELGFAFVDLGREFSVPDYRGRGASERYELVGVDPGSRPALMTCRNVGNGMTYSVAPHVVHRYMNGRKG